MAQGKQQKEDSLDCECSQLGIEIKKVYAGESQITGLDVYVNGYVCAVCGKFLGFAQMMPEDNEITEEMWRN